METMTKRQWNILISLLVARINESEGVNEWRETPYSKDLRDILSIIEGEADRNI